MSSLTPRVATFLFGSGLAALVYQTAWERMLRLVFGASTAASSAVLAIFLGGLGLGGAWLGKRAEAADRPLRLYGSLEVGVALSAAVTPFLVDLVARVYWGLGGSGTLGTGGATALRLLLAAIVLGPPVVLMGGTLPAAARAVERDDDLSRGQLATLYAANTIGAVAGALLGTFVLFEVFGTRLSLWIAALVNLLVAVLARQLGSSLAPVPVTGGASEAPHEASASAPSRISSRLVYVAAAVVGFAFLSLEIVWYRMLGPILGGSSFTFGLVLAVALAGIGVGSFIYTRRTANRPATLSLLALTVALEAVCVLTPLALGDSVAYLAAYTRPMASLGFVPLVVTWLAITSVVVLPAAVVAGYQFPVLFALLGSGRSKVARQVGLTYAFNTAGSIAGALTVGFVLLPRLGAVGIWKLVGAILLVLALVLIGFELKASAKQGLRRARLAVAFAVLTLWMLTAEGPTAVSRHTPIGAGRVTLAGLDRNQLRDWSHRMRLRVLWERDGVESSLGVTYGGGITFLVSGKADGAVFGDRGTQTLLGIIPALLHDDIKSAFVLGLGTGMSAGWLAAVPGVERVDVAELEPAIVEVARAASLANQNVLERPNVHMFLGDGREFLLTHERKYDLIVSEPSNPYRAGVASLFTHEFYRVAARRMKPNGLFGQWVQGYEVDVQTVRIVIATLRSVFPFVEAWQTQGGDLLLLAGMEPRVYDAEQLRRRVQVEPYRTILPRAGLISDAEGVLSRLIAGNALVKAIGEASAPPVNSDDDNVLEYAFARQVGIGGAELPVQLASLTQSRGLARPEVRGSVDWRRVDELRGRAWLVIGSGTGPDLPLPDPDARARAQAFAAGCSGDIASAQRLWFSQKDAAPRDVVEKYVLAQILAQQKDDRALVLAGELGQEGYTAEEHIVRARYLAGQGKRVESLDELLLAIGELRKTALPLCDANRQAIDLLLFVVRGEPALAAKAARGLLAGPLAVYNEEERRINVAQRLAFQSGDSALCVQSLGQNLALPWWQLRFLAARAECLEKAGHPAAGRARAELAEWVASSSGNVEVGLTLPPPLLPSFEPEDGLDAGLVTPPHADAAFPLERGSPPDGAGHSDADASAKSGSAPATDAAE
ncbi:MAG: fused MFS/spermidine synthase [Polyangiaceae bacterium]|nr:fused MFS/spermidine synthase [Polyangiaceae bacterium]MCL4751267.1 fused MFS/spermidine synthase [Myxococcales bacterium]